MVFDVDGGVPLEPVSSCAPLGVFAFNGAAAIGVVEEVTERAA